MANIRAAQNGDFSATSTWVGGVVPGSGDVAYANTFTVTISDTRTVQAISNDSATGITAGGTFSILNGCNLTCTNANGLVMPFNNVTNNLITVSSLLAGQSAFIAANCSGGSFDIGNGATFNFSSGGTLNTTGNLQSAWRSSGLFNISGTGTLNHTGSISVAGGLGGSTSPGVVLSGNGAVNITGTVTGSSGDTSGQGYGVRNSSSSGTITINGTVLGLNAAGAINTSTGFLTINGTCQSSSTQPAIGAGSNTQTTRLSGPFLLGASGNINPVQAQSWRWAPTQIPTYYEVPTSGGSTKRNLYTADNMPTGGYPVVANVRQSTVYGPSNEFTGTLAVPSPSSVALGVATDNTVGTAILTASSVRSAMGLASANLDTQFSNIPSNVWAALTSALSTAGSVGKLLVDNVNATISSRLASSAYTTPLDAAGTRNALGLGSANLDTQLSNIPSSVWGSLTSALTTAGSVGKLLTDNINATISSRLASSAYTSPLDAAGVRSALGLTSANLDTQISNIPGYTWSNSVRTITGGTVDTLVNAPVVPTPSEIASQVRTELNTELGRIDTTVSSRLDQYGTLARVTLVDTVTTLTNAPLVPTPGEIATQVRTELFTELSRIDTTISSRLASSDYVLAPTTSEIRTELSTELARIDTTISSRLASSDYMDPATPPEASTIATAVRQELTPELERLANCATVDTTVATIQDALQPRSSTCNY